MANGTFDWAAMARAASQYETADAATAASALQSHITNGLAAWKVWKPAWDQCLADRVKANPKAKPSVKGFQEWAVKNIVGAKWTVDIAVARSIVAFRAHTLTVRSAFGKYCERTNKDETIVNYLRFLEGVDRGDYDAATGKDTKQRTTRIANAQTSSKARAAVTLETTYSGPSFASVVVGKQYKEGLRQLLILEQNLGAAIAAAASKLTEAEADEIRREVNGKVSDAVKRS